MSEAGMITSNPLKGARVPGTVGFVLPEGEVRLRSEEGEPVPEGAVGVLRSVVLTCSRATGVSRRKPRKASGKAGLLPVIWRKSTRPGG